MQKQIVVLSISTLVLLSTLVAGSYLYIMNRQDNGNSEKFVAASSGKPSRSTNQQPQDNTALQVQGAQTKQAPTQQRLPEPSEFTVYEKFASAQNTQYIDIIMGTGELTAVGDTVAVAYAGWLTNGLLFDKSKVNEQNQIEPFVFKIGDGGVIRGWEEGIVGMKVGGQRRLIIPSQLGYGPTGAGEGAIPPNSMLIFDVELAQVKK